MLAPDIFRPDMAAAETVSRLELRPIADDGLLSGDGGGGGSRHTVFRSGTGNDWLCGATRHESCGTAGLGPTLGTTTRCTLGAL